MRFSPASAGDYFFEHRFEHQRTFYFAKMRSICKTQEDSKNPGNLVSSGVFFGTPDAIRTHDLQSRRLPAASAIFVDSTGFFYFRGTF